MRVQRAIETLSEHLRIKDPVGVLGFYLYGSAVTGGPRPDSDVDLLMLTERSLSVGERRGLVKVLLQFSGSRATVEPGRPLELTSLVVDDVVPWTYPPVCDFLYGEWLREDFADGEAPRRHINPDLAVLLTTVQQNATCILGPKPADVLQPVPAHDLRRSLRDSLEPLLDDLAGDERNVLLTLARMVITCDTGQIVPKDEAARRLLPNLPQPYRSVMATAVRGYLGELQDSWADRKDDAQLTARYLAEHVRSSA